MNSYQLAEKFDATAKSLESQGHLIIVRRARSYLDDGRPDLAASFLVEATRRMPGSPIRDLSDAFHSWRLNEGDLDALLAEPQWVSSTHRENELSETLRAKTLDHGHETLLSVIIGDTPLEAPDEPQPSEKPQNLPVVWDDEEPTSEVFEAPSTIYQRPDNIEPPPPDEQSIPDPLIAGIIVMLQALTIYFCFFRPS